MELRLRKLLSILAVSVFLGSFTSASYAQKVAVGGGPLGGTYYVLATGFAKILNEDAGLEASVEVGGGGVQNIKLIEADQTDFGITMASLYDTGLKGTGWAKGKKYENVTIMFPMQLSYLHFWTLKKTGLRSVNDLNGHIVNVSKKGSGADVAGRKIVEMFNLKPKSIINLGHTDANQAMQDNLAHAALTAGSIPHPAVAALSTTHDVVQFGLVGNQATEYLKVKPSYVTTAIPANTYRGQTEPVPTVGDYNVMICNKNASEELVYKIVKATYENIPKWASVHKAAASMDPEGIKGLMKYSVHPGALRYYREIGILN